MPKSEANRHAQSKDPYSRAMDYEYRLENVDPKLTEALKKGKEEQREKQRLAWEAERRQNQQEAPVQQQQS